MMQRHYTFKTVNKFIMKVKKIVNFFDGNLSEDDLNAASHFQLEKYVK